MIDWQLAGVAEINQAIAQGMEPLACEEPLKLSEWADSNFYLVPESSSIEGPWVTLPYQKGIMNVISNPDVQVVTVRKSARVGYTKILVAGMGYFAAHHKRNQLIFQPTDTDAQDFTAKEIDTMLRECPAVGGLLKCKVGAKHKYNTVSSKSFWGSVLDILGGKSPTKYRRLTKDVVWYDELDGFDHNIGGEGDPVKLGDKRLETSSFPKSIRGSTPKMASNSLIEKSGNMANTRLKRFLPCPFCAAMFALEWDLFSWQGQENELTVKLKCPHCHSDQIRHHHYPDMDACGKWQSAETGVWLDDDDLFHNQAGELIQSPRSVCFDIWSAYSYYSTWDKIVAEYLEAEAEEKRGDSTLMVTFTNTTLGQAYKPKIGEERRCDVIERLQDDGPADLIPDWALAVFLTADIQKHGIWYEIRAWKEDRTSRLIQWGYLPKDLGYEPTLEMEGDFKALGQKMATVFVSATGQELGVNLALIDSGYRTTEVYQFCKVFEGMAYPTKGHDRAKSRPISYSNQEVMPGTGKAIEGGLSLVNVETCHWKDKLSFRLKVNVSDPGAWIIYHNTGLEYAKHYTAEIKNEETGTWENPNKKDNHLWDCGVLQMVAFQIREDQGMWKGLAADRLARMAGPVSTEMQQRNTQAPRRPKLW